VSKNALCCLYAAAVALLAHKLRGVMFQSPRGVLGGPSLLDLNINLWNFQTWKFHRASSVKSASRFLILKRCRSTQQIQQFTTIFVASCETGGAKPKRGVHPCSNVHHHRAVGTANLFAKVGIPQ